jgi:hypothetical protein
MRKLLMLIVAAAALTSWSYAQDQDVKQDQDKKQDQDVKKDKNHAKKDKDADKKADRDADNDAKKRVDRDRDAARDRDNSMPNRDVDRDRDANRDRDTDANRDRDRDNDANRGDVANRNTAAREDSRDEAAERTVHITNGPNVNPSSHSASISWNTNKNAATDVWLMGGGIRGHRTEYDRGGSTNHNVTFSNLRPHTTYTYEIRTREGEDRKQGSFTTR